MTGGHRHDVTQAEELLKGWKTIRVLADKGYDSNAILAQLAVLNAEAVIPPKSSRVIQRVYDKEFYKVRHLVQISDWLTETVNQSRVTRVETRVCCTRW